MQMRLKKLGMALFVVAALGAVLASSAFATATTTEANWFVNGSKLAATATPTVANKTGTTAKFVTEVAGQPVELTSTAVTCEECSISNSPAASGKGFLKFTVSEVMKPTGCTLSSVKTKKLVVSADYMEGEAAMVKFTPEAGETAGFATFELGGGGACPLAGTPITPKGVVYGKAVNKTGVEAASQEVNFSPTINSNAGGSLKVGEKAATLEATAVVSVEGKNFSVK
jgi:hypothetical protein